MESSQGPIRPYEGSSNVNYGFGAQLSGWQFFAALMILFTGVWNLIEGFIGLVRSTYFIGHAVYGDLWICALVWIGFGILQVAAGLAIINSRGWGRWFGIVIASLDALIAMLSLGTYPFWALVVLAIQFAVLYGLTVRWTPVPAGT